MLRPERKNNVLNYAILATVEIIAGLGAWYGFWYLLDFMKFNSPVYAALMLIGGLAVCITCETKRNIKKKCA